MSNVNDSVVRVEGREASAEAAPRKKQRRGFAAMDPAKQRTIASKGGKASHQQGTGHEWNSQTAREAGRKGGMASHGGRGKRQGEGSASAPSVGYPAPAVGSLVQVGRR